MLRKCINPFPNKPWVFTCLQYKGFENIALYKQFLLFPQCFLHFWKTCCRYNQIGNCRLQTLEDWKSLNFVIRERVKAPPPPSKNMTHFNILLNSLPNDKSVTLVRIQSICKHIFKCG